jgi:pilus assembly protein CpaE
VSAPATQVRLLLVEDVPQVAQYIRSLLNSQDRLKLLDVLTDGKVVVDRIRELRPDVLIVDALLQGKVDGLKVAEDVRAAGLDIPIIALTVPQKPIEIGAGMGVARVLPMPFGSYELVSLVQTVHAEAIAAAPGATSRVYSFYAPKGGVGKTTLAFNTAVVLAKLGPLKVALIDGNFQFGDLRSLLRVPLDAPSIVDLPTDRIQESDLADVLWRDPSGVDVLLAPPRIEMAEMVTVRDVEKALSMIRQVYNIVVIDTPPMLSESVLAFLDSSDRIISVVTSDVTTLHNTRAVAETFAAIGYPADKVMYLLNRADATGGIDPRTLEQLLGRGPDFSVVSDGRLVVESNNQGIPFVLANPSAPISLDVARLAMMLGPGRGAALQPVAGRAK